jgi:hypothetical protein
VARNTSQYLHELFRRDQEQQAGLGDLIADALASGDGRPVTDELVAELRTRAFGDDE